MDDSVSRFFGWLFSLWDEPGVNRDDLLLQFMTQLTTPLSPATAELIDHTKDDRCLATGGRDESVGPRCPATPKTAGDAGSAARKNVPIEPYQSDNFSLRYYPDHGSGPDENIDSWLGVACHTLEALLSLDRLKAERDQARDEVRMHLQQEQRVMQSQKLEAVGQLVAGLTHEINNKLGPILIYTQLALTEDPEEKLKYQLEVIESNTLAIREIIDSLVSFTSLQEPARSIFSINDSLRNTVKMLKYRFENQGVEYRFQFDEELPLVSADRGQLELVFLNLVGNALDALKGHENGQLSVETRRDGVSVLVFFKNNGPGIPDEDRARVFEPFFSTKALGRGTGLGLSAAYGIVRSHGGELSLGSEGGEGSIFILNLPIIDLADDETADPSSQNGMQLAPGRSCHILLVDDDQQIRSMIRDALADAENIHFTTARDGAEANRLLDTMAYDIVLCDLKMPRFSGRELYGKLIHEAPEMLERLIFMTGDRLDPETKQFLKSTGLPCLIKPFTLEELSDRIFERLGPEVHRISREK